MIYSWCTFLDCYNVFSLLQAYFLPSPSFRKTTLMSLCPVILWFRKTMLSKTLCLEQWYSLNWNSTEYYKCKVHMCFSFLSTLHEWSLQVSRQLPSREENRNQVGGVLAVLKTLLLQSFTSSTILGSQNLATQRDILKISETQNPC
jgi:hypothetical protein